MTIDTARSKLKSQETRFHKQELKMRAFRGIAIAAGLGGGIALMTTLSAQPPGPPNRDRGGGGQPADPTSYIARLMSFDKNQDGQLSKDEITDSRLVALFERADANADGIVTKEELTADFNQEIAKLGAEGQGGGPGGGGGLRGGPPGPGGGGGFPGGGGGGRGERRIGGPGGPGFPGGPGGPCGPGMGGPGNAQAVESAKEKTRCSPETCRSEAGGNPDRGPETSIGRSQRPRPRWTWRPWGARRS